MCQGYGELIGRNASPWFNPCHKTCLMRCLVRPTSVACWQVHVWSATKILLCCCRQQSCFSKGKGNTSTNWKCSPFTDTDNSWLKVYSWFHCNARRESNWSCLAQQEWNQLQEEQSMKKIKEIISLLGCIGAITSISTIAFNQKPFLVKKF